MKIRNILVIAGSFIFGFSTCLVFLTFNSTGTTSLNLYDFDQNILLHSDNEDAKIDATDDDDLQNNNITDTSNQILNIGHDVLHELNILTGGYDGSKELKCPHPLVPFHNRIIRNENDKNNRTETVQMIPKIFHISMKSRCVPRDYAMYLDRWKEKLPNYSIFFHDDEAVAKLIDLEWQSYPELHTAMKCVIFKGAMTIDIWRVLVLLKYGGLYSDIDNWPMDIFTEEKIPSNVSAFFFHDAYNRPTQHFMALEPNHPMLDMSMKIIIQNILNMERVSSPKVVFVTGPNALKWGYFTFLSSKCCNGILTTAKVFENDVVLEGFLGKTVLKARGLDDYVVGKLFFNDIVPYNATLNVTRQQRITMDSGVKHWQAEVKKQAKSETTPNESCKDYLQGLSSGKISESEKFS